LLGLFALAALAEEPFPSRPVRLIVPYAVGGFPDSVTRVVSQRASELFGQPLVVENRPGAGGLQACEAVARAQADGYTLLIADNAHWGVNPSLYAKLPYDILRDFAPVAMLGETPMFLFVHASLPVTNVQELIALAKAKPNQLNYGSSGIGSLHHLTMEVFKAAAGLEIVHIPYKGSGQSVPALMGGQTSLMIASLPSLTAHVKAGNVRMLAVVAERRMRQAPEVPTFAEQGVQGLNFLTHVGVMAPSATPAAVVARMNAVFNKALEDPDVIRRLALIGVEPAPATPQAFGVQIREELKKYAHAVKVSGAVAN
jgi:tripartite-type tricarboxylate transporter receptor subunit TctC